MMLKFLVGFAAANPTPLHDTPADSLNLLQVGAREILRHKVPVINYMNGTKPWNAEILPFFDYTLSLVQDGPHRAKALQTSCAPLTNQGAFFSVELSVGTPPQRFNVVADTGSDAVIIPSCVCDKGEKCDWRDRCYRGANYSSTFRITERSPRVSMEFGSGTILSVVATDTARVGDISATMKNALLLMVDSQLDIDVDFFGILGLGQLKPNLFGKPNHHQGDWDSPVPREVQIPGFLELAGVDTFSICFNDDDPGALRLNTPVPARSLPSYGQSHWGLNFLGISVGDAKVPALFCHEKEACGAIPDSGTTLMVGPTEQVRDLFRRLCDLWPRCAAATKRNPSEEREDHFQMLLLGCQGWMGANGIEELPSIFLHFDAPKGGTTLEIAPSSYIIDTLADTLETHAELLGNIVSKKLRVVHEMVALHSPNRYVCTPAFGATDLEIGTSPLWILGTPLFYEYVVSFDRKSSPPSIAFSTDSCGSCFAEKTIVTGVKTTVVPETAREYLLHRDRPTKIRRIKGTPRVNRHPKQHMYRTM